MGLDVNVVCRNYREDRVIPRFSRYLSNHLGYVVSASPIPGFDLYYLSAYFEVQRMKSLLKTSTMAAYFTHRELVPVGNSKSRLFDRVADLVDLRIATAAMYAEQLLAFGNTVQINPPVERHRFTIPKRRKNKRLVCGFSGFTYSNHRKGEVLARSVVNSKSGRGLRWVASGRGWPVPTTKFPWSELPAFYQSLDVLVVTASVEGVPMPPLEVLSCGGSIVIPRGVGLLDELPSLPGIHRYKKGDVPSLLAAFEAAIELRSKVDRAALRDVTDPYSITAWCEQHRFAFEECFV